MEVSGVLSGMENLPPAGTVPSGIGGLPDLGLAIAVFQDRQTDTLATAQVSLADGSFTAMLPEGTYTIHAGLISTVVF